MTMTTAKSPTRRERPMSPHLQVYRPQVTSGLSILHRVTGAGMTLGVPVFVAWLVALASGPEGYQMFLDCAHTMVGRLLLYGWSFAFFYHFACGIRHLLWNAGLCLEIKDVYSTGRVALPAAALVTIAIWGKILLGWWAK